MKILISSVAVILSVAWSSGAFAAIDEVHHIVTGTVVSISITSYIDIDTHDGGSFGAFIDNRVSYKPKVGDNVKVHYYWGGRHNYADKIEKIGRTETNPEKPAHTETKTPSIDVATTPNVQASESEPSFNKSEVSVESIASAFVQAYSGADADAVASLYANRVDHTDSGVISNAAVRAQAREYFARWPMRQWSLVGQVITTSLGATKQKVVFSASYDASNPQTNKHASGIARETLILAADRSGAMKIVSQREQTSKSHNTRSSEETPEVPRLNAAKTEYEHSSHDEAARVRYVTTLAAMLGEGMEYWWRTHDKMGGPNLDGVQEELIKHPAPANADSTALSQLLVGKWLSPRHVYEFRADGTYGMADTEQRDKWRIDGNEYIDEVSHGTLILIDDKYFAYTDGQGVTFYLRAKDPIKSDKPSDVALRQRIVGYWKNPKVAFHMAADGKMYDCPRRAGGDIDPWDVRGGKFYWSGVEYEIVTLTDNKFVYRETGSNPTTFTWTRSTKEEVDPE